MDVRTMLELAAKAAGLKHVNYAGSDYDGKLGLQLVDEIGRQANLWNPLTDDGDALRLAVKLGIAVFHAGATHLCESEDGAYLADEVDPEGDGTAATRRAITRAAATLAKGEGKV